MTYYKYVSREGADVVDWGAITKSVSESLGQVAKDREAKRESIADASRQYGETLSNAPMGESKTINDFTIEYANNAEKYRLMQDRLLRSGQMSLKDYNLGRANLTSGTTDLFNLSKEYNAVYADKMERMNKKDSSLAESWAMGNIEGYSNFSKSSAYIDPTNGRVAVGMKVKKTLPDGKEVFELSENPNDLKSVNELKNIINTKYDRFKIAQNLQPEVDKLSKTIEVLMEDGVETREDARLNENYLDSRNTFINSVIETKPDIPMSVLVDYLGVVPDEKGEPTDVSFEFTYDPDEAATSDKFILMEPNKDTGRYEANLTKSQKEMARKALTAKFESMVDKVDTAMPIQRQAPLSAGERTAQQEGEIGFGLALDLTSGGSIAGEALEKIKANNNAIDNVYETETSYVIQYKDGSEDKTINKIMRDGLEAREETAVSLMAAVNPNYDATKAETAKQRYLKTNTIGERKEKGLFGKRTAISSQNTSTYQTKSEVAKGDKGVSISQQIEKLPTPDEDNAGQVLDVIKDIYPLPGTESFINQIQVTGGGLPGAQDVLIFKLPPEFIPFVQDLSGVTMGEGNNIQIDYDAKKDKATLKNVIDGIIAGMYDIYNKSDAINRTEDTPPETATGATTTDNNTSGAAKFNP